MRWIYVRHALNALKCAEISRWRWNSKISAHLQRISYIISVHFLLISYITFSTFSAHFLQVSAHLQSISYIISAHSAHFLQKDALKRRWHLDPGLNAVEKSKFLWKFLNKNGKWRELSIKITLLKSSANFKEAKTTFISAIHIPLERMVGYLKVIIILITHWTFMFGFRILKYWRRI